MASSKHKSNRKLNTDLQSVIYPQIGVCLILTFVFLIISKVNTEVMTVVHNNIRNVLNYNVDIKSTAGNLLSDITEVLNSDSVPTNSQN